MRRAAVFLLAAACGPPEGGLTAQLRFEPAPVARAGRGLRAASVPAAVARLEIEVLDPAGEVLGATRIARQPDEGESLLNPNGGTWLIDGVPAGEDRSLVARGRLGDQLGPEREGEIGYEGRLDGLRIDPGEVTDAGELVLRSLGGRELDFDPPAAPAGLDVQADPIGGRLRVAWSDASEDGVAGYLLAVSLVGAEAPNLPRRSDPAVGSQLRPGLEVHARPASSFVEVLGLEDGRAVRVLLYAHDDDDRGAPLNWSAPAEAVGVPADTAAPEAPGQFRAEEVDATRVRLSFSAPADPGRSTPPERYELRVGTERRFDGGGELAPPPVAPPGAAVEWVVDTRAAGRRWLGLRAVDRAGNAGEAAFAEVGGAGALPRVTSVPPFAVAGAELVLEGERLGASPGTAAWVETSTVRAARVLAWTQDRVAIEVPAEARGGRIELSAPGAGAALSPPVGVVHRSRIDLPNDTRPFELIGGRVLPGGRRRYALHRESGSSSQTAQKAILRIADEEIDGPWLARAEPRSAAIGGDYDPALDVYGFVSGGDPAQLSTAAIRGSTVAADATRLPAGAVVGGVDGLALFLTGGTADRPAATLALTRAGVLRAARVDDLRIEPFSSFFAYSSTSAGYRAVRGARSEDGSIRLAMVESTGGVDRLAVWDGTDPAALSPIDAPIRPTTGDGIAMLALPGGDFVIAHERTGPGPTTVAVFLLSQWARGEAVLLPREPGLDERLEDLGLLETADGVRVVVLSSGRGRSALLRWTELPEDLGAVASAVIDVGDGSARGRLGCKPRPGPTCLALWVASGSGPRVRFERR